MSEKTPQKTPQKTAEKAPEKSDLVTLTIDGVQTSVPKNTLVIRAAEEIGVQIPRFCDHPLLDPVGACRQCLVEVPDAGNGRAIPKPQASCTLTVAEGMVVNTQATSPVAEKAQAGIMEFLLINHPLDCPVCDKGGECPLQNQAMSNGQGESRFHETGGVKRTFPKPINISAQVLLDRERCVLCARCTRFSEQIAGDPFIALIERGALQQVGIYEHEPFSSYFSGNTIQICPVGALTSADYRFRSRPFDLVSTPGVGEHDACGAAIRVDHRRGKVMRRLSGNDPEVNQEWISDKDRFAFSYTRGADRLEYPQVRDENGELRPASWPEAFAVAARGLRAALERGGVGVLPGGRVTAEDAFGYSTFARVALGTNDIDFRARPSSAEEAAFLAEHVVLTSPDADGPARSVSYADLDAAATVVLVGLEPEDEAGTIFLRLRAANRSGGTAVLALAPYTTNGLRKLGAELVPTAPGDEADALRRLAEGRTLDPSTVVLLGERLAGAPGAFEAAAELARSTGARLAWVPRRAGDRGAVETGCLPGLLPGGRPVTDASARVDAAAAWGVGSLPEEPGRDLPGILAALGSGDLRGLVIGGVDLDDLPDPHAARAALDGAFVVSLELRESDVTSRADVVLPVAAVTDRPGMFVNWEGRPRPFPQVFEQTGTLPDVRVLAGIAEELGRPLGFRSSDEARARMIEFGPWEPEGTAGEQDTRDPLSGPAGTEAPGAADTDGLRLATWKQMLDLGRMQDGDENLRATARPAIARLPRSTYDALGGPARVVLTGDRGSATLPAEPVEDLVEGTVWVPSYSFGRGVLAELSSPGGRVSVTAEGASR